MLLGFSPSGEKPNDMYYLHAMMYRNVLIYAIAFFYLDIDGVLQLLEANILIHGYKRTFGSRSDL